VLQGEPCHHLRNRVILGHVGTFAAVDVYYPHSGGAQAALVLATDPTFATITRTATAFLPDTVPYQSGEFYRRELPALHAVPRRCGIATMFTARRLCALP
jgi:deoxyinosine 3'endonuclease (endonuclease V)